MIIKLANDIASVVNHDTLTRDLLRLVFLPNYNVSLAEIVIRRPICRNRSRPPAWRPQAPAT